MKSDIGFFVAGEPETQKMLLWAFKAVLEKRTATPYKNLI